MNKLTMHLLCLALFLLIIPSVYAGEPETLLGVTVNFDKKEFTIKVVSTGCTNKSDFKFQMKDDELTIIRTKKDECKMMPEELTLTYTLKEAGIDPNKPFKIVNKFIVNLNIANTK